MQKFHQLKLSMYPSINFVPMFLVLTVQFLFFFEDYYFDHIKG